MDRKKKWMARIFAGFFLAMAACTVLSRAAASVLVAQVTAEKPGRGKLSYAYNGSGTVVPVKENQIFLWPGQQVEWIAPAGSTVKAGECLVRFRMEYLQQTIEQKEAEVKQLELQGQQQEISARGTARVPAAVSAAQTLEDAQRQLQTARQKAAAAQAAYGDAAQAVYGQSTQSAYGDAAQAAYGQSAQSTYGDAAQTVYGQSAGRGSAGNEGAAADQERLQELETALQQAQAELEAAQQAADQAQNAYDLAVQEDAAQDANETNLTESAELGVQSLEVQLRQVQKELEKLKSYRDAGGKLCAEQECTVLQSEVPAGTVTTGAELLVTGSGGWRLCGNVDAADREKLKAGDEAEIRLGTGGKKSVTIESVGTGQSNPGIRSGAQTEDAGQSVQDCWYAPVPETASVKGGETFTWSVEAVSEKEYEQTIPLGALRESTDGAYCLVLSEEKSMLGTVQKAKRVPVTVLEKDAKNAAVTSSLKETDRVIVSSEKYVEEGDRVRLKE